MLQIQLTGFLDKDTAKFCKELWLLCLSAQSNPQGVPKELLEAKKLELIQEKVYIHAYACESFRLTISDRSTLRKPRKKHSDGRTKRNCGIGTSTASGRESEVSVDVAVVEVVETITTTTDVHLETRGHHPPDDEVLLATEVLRPAAKLIPISRVAVAVAVPKIGDGGHPLLGAQALTLDHLLGPRHVEGIEKATHRGRGDGSTLQADPEHPHVEDIVEIDTEEEQDAVMIELDP